MAKAKPTLFTPGPWTVDIKTKTFYNAEKMESHVIPDYYVRYDGGLPICHVSISNMQNASLISASPDLFDGAIKAIAQLRKLETLHKEEMEESEIWRIDRVVTQLSDALKKARGV